MVTTSRSHLEMRIPFWDYALIDFIYSLRPEVRGHQTLYRHIITRRTPGLSVIPYDKQEFCLPSSHCGTASRLCRCVRGGDWSFSPSGQPCMPTTRIICAANCGGGQKSSSLIGVLRNAGFSTPYSCAHCGPDILPVMSTGRSAKLRR